MDRLLMGRRRLYLKGLTGVALAPLPGLAGAQAAPPSAVVDETWSDAGRQRDIPVRLRWPDANRFPGPRPVVLFSHGLGGTRDVGTVWGTSWAEAGFMVIHLQHAGSDLPTVQAVASSFADRAGLRSAAGPQQLIARLRDVGFVLDEVGRRHAAKQERWREVRATRIGMSGHSFGAHTTLGVAGQSYPGFAGMGENRLASFIAFSPTVPVVGDAQAAFAALTRPVLCVTGTPDSDVLGNGATPDKRNAVFAALPKGGKAHLVLQDADHMTFAGQTGRAAEIVAREQITRDLQATQHALVASITTDWWLATQQDDDAARARLATPQGLRQGDRWKQK